MALPDFGEEKDPAPFRKIQRKLSAVERVDNKYHFAFEDVNAKGSLL